MMGKLKIRCTYEKNGCREVLLLDNLDNHEKSCRFDERICNKCCCKMSGNHDCVESLLISKQKLIESHSELKEELHLALDRISSLESEIGNYLQTIQELTNASEENTIPIKRAEV
jgi:hypothetical protein